MIDKVTSLDKALENVKNGQIVMTGGFGVPGTPFLLIQGVLDKGICDLTLIKNEANEAGLGVSRLIEAGRVKKLLTSHLGLNARVIGMMNENLIDVEFFPQGILAEKIRAGGAGLLGIITDIGIDTILCHGRQAACVNGRQGLIEPSLRADISLVHASKADRAGNLIYEKSARNFNPLMAMAGDLVIVEAETIVETGQIPPDEVHTPGAFVDHVVLIETLMPEYGVLEHHVH